MPRSPRARARTKALRSGKKKVLVAVRRAAAPCSTFALTQRNDTCYMAAATLLFARAALRQCVDADVRRFVRLSMANAWDRAQGDASDPTCPLVPKKIRQCYADLAAEPDVFGVQLRTARDLTCARTKTCVEPPLALGGSQDKFLVALFWAAKLRCQFKKVVLLLDERERVQFPRAGRGTRAIDFVVDQLPPAAPAGAHVVVDAYMDGDGIDADATALLDMLGDAFRRSRLEGVLMALTRGAEGAGHTLSLYPCLSGGALAWTVCNSWGDDCAPRLEPVLRAMRDREGYSMVKNLTFLVGSA